MRLLRSPRNDDVKAFSAFALVWLQNKSSYVRNELGYFQRRSQEEVRRAPLDGLFAISFAAGRD